MATATKKTTDTNAVENTSKSAFSKKQLRESKRYSKYKDVLGVVLEDDKTYTIEQCEAAINDFMNKTKKKGGK